MPKSLLIALLLLTGILSQACASSRYSGPPSDHYDGHLFFNPHADTDKQFYELIKFYMGKISDWPDWVENEKFPLPEKQIQSGIELTFINHATVLIQVDGLNILTDPVYSKRVSPLSFVGPKRVRDPGVAFENLPPIDLVLVSHNHYDHMDMETLKRLNERFHPKFIVPLGDKLLLADNGIKENVFEMDWWQKQEINSKSSVTFTPVVHWSNRGFDKRESLWGGFFVQGPSGKVFFAGDCGYSEGFAQIYEKLGAPDVSLLPIGAYIPRWFLKVQHMDPADAVQAHQDLHSKFSLGIHYGTFKLAAEAIDQPPKDLLTALQQKNISASEFITLPEGKVFKVPKTDEVQAPKL